MREKKTRISCYIPDELYTKMVNTGRNITEIAMCGIEHELEPTGEDKESNPIESIVPEVIEAKDSLIQSLEVHTNDLNKRIESLDEQLKAKDTGHQCIIENLEEQLKAKDDGFRERIEDFKEQLKIKDSQLEIIDSRMEDRVRSLEEQLRVKDTQLENKDSQLEKQAIHIQTMISQKAIEVPGAKKPWWQFW